MPYFIRTKELRSNRGKTIESIITRAFVLSTSAEPNTARMIVIKNKTIVGPFLSCILLPPMLE